MLLGDTEHLALRVVAMVGLGAVLVAVGDTGLYPLVLGAEVVALIAIIAKTGASPVKPLAWIGTQL